MPDPKGLRVGDKVRFVSVPEEWSAPSYHIDDSSVRFYRGLVRRRFPSRVREVDANGNPWILAIIRERGRVVHHYWAITERTGWRLVRPRGGAD